jgi:hypothetical protein
MPQDPRRLANAPEAEQRAFVIQSVLADPVAAEVLERARKLDLPDWALIAGAVYQAVWNELTGREPGFGVNDYDLAYFDADDLTEAGEDAVVARAAEVFAGITPEVEVCNQARVHIWFNRKFGTTRPALTSTEDAVRQFASTTHAVAIRLTREGQPELITPYGLNGLFSLYVEPMPDISTPDHWNSKIARQKEQWPEIEFIPATAI